MADGLVVRAFYRVSDRLGFTDPFDRPTAAEPHGAEDGTEVRMRRVGKKAAGRQLDGREWNEFPANLIGAAA